MTVECTYDTMGRRATKKVTTNGTLTEHRRFLYRGYLQIACCDLTRAYTPALWFILWDPTQNTATRPLAIQKNSTWYTYGWDLTKNICETYRTDGRIDLAFTYTPYGEVSPVHTYDQPLRWSSEYHDTELGLVYYNYRHYSPVMGKWMGRDNVLNIESFKACYLFANNLPTFYVDYLGKAVNSASDINLRAIPQANGTVQDVINAINDALKNKKSCCVSKLTWVLHGAGGLYMIIGPGDLPLEKYNNAKDPNLANKIDSNNAKPIFDSMAKQVNFCQICEIYLLSCNMGLKDKIPQTLADTTGCIVYAPAGYCYANPKKPERSKIRREFKDYPVYPNSQDDTFYVFIPLTPSVT